jgi:CTP:molybdopterin cytidylyltransferase MocA
MGRQKLLLELRGRPIIRWSVEAVAPHVDEVIVVTGHDEPGVRCALAGLSVRYARNPNPEAGQGSSIAVGAAALSPDARAALVALGDQPYVPGAVVAALLADFARGGTAIVVPVYRGTQATPVVFGAEVFAELRALTGDGGARSVVRAHPERVRAVSFDIPLPADVDTPEDYARLM